MRSKRSVILAVIGLLFGGVAISQAIPHRSPSPSSELTAATVTPYAPYVDTTLWPLANLTTLSQASGIKTFTMAFITAYQGNSCQAAWGGYYPLGGQAHEAQNIADLRAIGGDVIISFGGEAGSELAQTCNSAAALEAQYQAVVDRYQVYNLDFDIEGATLNDQATIDMRSEAIALLQHNEAALGHTVTISFTLPVLPSGLLSNSLYLLRSAISHGVNVSLVNIMTMDYGDGAAPNPAGQMGTYAVDALQATHTQLEGLFTNKSAAQLWSMMGATPMIGQNDLSDEVFGLTDANQLTSFAQSVQLGRLSSWSVARDGQCPQGVDTAALNTCSGVLQSPYEFANIFSSTDGSGSPSTSTTSTTSTTQSPSGTTRGLSVTFAKTSTWWGGYSAKVTLVNESSTTLFGWNLALELVNQTSVSGAWDATYTAPVIGSYLFTNATWNGTIAPGGSTSFGFTVTSPNEVPSDPIFNAPSTTTSTTTTHPPSTTTTSTTTPTTTTQPPSTTTTSTTTPTTTTQPPVTSGSVSLTFLKGSTWWGGYSGTFTITNNSSVAIDSWVASFTLPVGTEITNSWNATAVTASPNYRFSNTLWNGTLSPGRSTTFGVTVSSTSQNAPLPANLAA